MKFHSGVFLLVLFLSTVVFAGQMSSHVYTGLRSKEFLSGKALTIVNAHIPAYLAGSQGPDVTGVVMPALDGYSTGSSAGIESHYSPLKAHLAVNLLDAARNEDEIAYAIGWISHYINDIHVHAVVNEYGGFYEKAPIHHKELEQLETRYVLDVHKDVVTDDRCNQDYSALGANFAEFILNAYLKTFPQSEIYSTVKPSYYCSRFNEAASNCTAAHQTFYATATQKSRKGVHQFFSKARMLFPNMPSFEDYDAFSNAVEITDVKADKDKLTATIKIHDDKGYGRFMANWEAAASKAIDYSRNTFAMLSQYMDTTAGAQKIEARKKLLAAIPKQNLDQPLDTFDYSKTIPGDKPWRMPAYSFTLTPMDNPGNAKTLTGRLSEITVKATRWCGTEDGETKLEIPIPSGAYPYEYELNVATFGLNDLKRSDYESRAWARNNGSTETVGDARVTVGEVFDASITLPSTLRSLPGKRQWLIMDEKPNSNRVHTNGKLKSSLTQFAISHQSVGKLPGNIEFMPQLEHQRYDVTAVEDKLDGALLFSKLQVSDPSLMHHFGPQWLVCVFLDHPQTGSMEYGTAYQKWQKTNQLVKPVWNLVDAKIASLSEAKRKQLQGKAENYQAELDKQNLSEAQQEVLMQRKFLELLGSVGLKLNPAQQALIKQADEERKLLDAKSNIYNCLFGKMIVQPCVIKLNVPEGWKDEVRDANRDREDGVLRRVSTKSLSSKLPDGMSLMSATATVDVKCGADPKLETGFQRDNRSSKDTRSATAVGDFTGTVIEHNEEDNTNQTSDYAHSITRDYLLKKGGTIIRITSRIYARGDRRMNGNQVIGDGIPAARAAATSLANECLGIVASFRLVQGPMQAGK